MLKHIQKNYYLEPLVLIIFVLAWLVSSPQDVIEGYIRIVTSESNLLTDYIALSGYGATLLNVALTMLGAMIIKEIAKAKIDGTTFAALIMLMGFSFFGKNILNGLPLYFGVYLWSLFSKKPFRDFFPVAIFSLGIAPITSVNYINGPPGVWMGIALGILYGFVVVPFATALKRSHEGMTLYNVGFANGMFAIILVSSLKIFGITIELKSVEHKEFSLFLILLCVMIATYFIMLSLWMKLDFKKYISLLKETGLAGTDYFKTEGEAATFFNVGITGYIAIAFAFLTGVAFNGLVVGGIISVMGFSAIGKNPKNSTPIMVGVVIMFLLARNVNPALVATSGFVAAMMFSTTLSPIAGKYGFCLGILAGMLHYGLVTSTGPWHSGIVLYNNGFAAGFVAVFLGSIAAAFATLKEEKINQK